VHEVNSTEQSAIVRRRVGLPSLIVAAAALATLVALAAVHYTGMHLDRQARVDEATLVLLSLAGYASLALTVAAIIVSVLAGFRRDDRPALLVTILTAYGCLMIVFADVYYQAAYFGDLYAGVALHERYAADARTGAPLRVYPSERGFVGIRHRLWSGVDWPFADVTRGTIPWDPALTPAQLRAAASATRMRDAVRFIPEAEIPVYLSCLHLSVITMTSVGYGDIAPLSFGARAAADIEAMCNTLLLIVGLGMLFGNWRTALAHTRAPEITSTRAEDRS